MLVVRHILRMLVAMDQDLRQLSQACVVVVMRQVHPRPGQLGEDHRDQQACDCKQLLERHAPIVAYSLPRRQRAPGPGVRWRYAVEVPSSTVEDYLKAILLAEQLAPGSLVSMGQVSAALEVTPGTVTSMVKTLADSGLVTYQPYSGVCLTPEGRQLALHVLRRHRLIELFLVQVMGIDWSEVHPEAERLEHVVSERLIERIDTLLGHPAVDPHGDPIPTAHGEVAAADVRSLLECAVGAPLRISRITDQGSEFLRLIERQGLRPGCVLSVVSRSEAADILLLRLESGLELSLGFRAASKILAEESTAR